MKTSKFDRLFNSIISEDVNQATLQKEFKKADDQFYNIMIQTFKQNDKKNVERFFRKAETYQDIYWKFRFNETGLTTPPGTEQFMKKYSNLFKQAVANHMYLGSLPKASVKTAIKNAGYEYILEKYGRHLQD